MGPKEKIERLAQTAEDRILLSRVWERLSAGQRRNIPATSCFLSPREQEIITLRYGLYGKEELTQREIAKRLNISRSYVSRIEKNALLKLREYF